MRQFYTYLHCRPNGTPFYVGKGCDSKGSARSNDFHKRNAYHKRVVEKLGGKECVKIFVFPCDSEDQAFSDEIQQITQLREDGYELCNIAVGGRGGLNHTPESLAAMSISMRGNTRGLGNKSKTGKTNSPEHTAKIIAGRKAHGNSAEHCLAISKFNKERWKNPTYRAKMCAMLKARKKTSLER